MVVGLVVLGLWAPLARADSGPSLNFTVSLAFDALEQGGIGVVRVTGADIVGVQAQFLDRLIDFYQSGNRANPVWNGLLAVNMEQKPDTYPLEITVLYDDRSRETWQGQVIVRDAGFLRQDVTVSNDLGYLLEPETDRAERARLAALVDVVTRIHYWDQKGFIKPLDSEFTSPFGAWRLYNESLWGRHTGVDLRGPAGTPLLAPAAGRVVLAERLDVRGNYVLIDHGWGVYSGLAHLSEIHVTRGQMVRQGQVIGISGSTGRSSGPHIHWEVTVNGEWVDPQQFLETQVP